MYLLLQNRLHFLYFFFFILSHTHLTDGLTSVESRLLQPLFSCFFSLVQFLHFYSWLFLFHTDFLYFSLHTAAATRNFTHCGMNKGSSCFSVRKQTRLRIKFANKHIKRHGSSERHLLIPSLP